MRVLFLHPDPPHTPPAYGVLPVGAFAIGSALQAAGHDMTILNLALERYLNPWFTLDTALQRFQPELILLELHWYVHATGALAAAQTCKAWNTQVPVVAGGLTASWFVTELLQPDTAIDGIIGGDAEIPVVELAQALATATFSPQNIANLSWKQSDGGILTSPKRWQALHLDDFTFKNYELLEHWSDYIQLAKVPLIRDVSGLPTHFWLANARGCVYTCDFCGGGRQAQSTIYGRNKIIQRDWLLLAADIEYLWERLYLQQVALSYDLALQRPSYYEPLLHHWQNADWEMGLYNECWQLPSLHFLEVFCQSVVPAQSTLVFSPISGSEATRRHNGKHYSNQALLEALAYLAQQQIPVQLFFNLNAQGQDREAFAATLALCRQIVDMYPPALLALYCQAVQPEPLSPRAGRMAPLTLQDYLQQSWKPAEEEWLQENQAQWELFQRDFSAYQQQISGYQAWPFTHLSPSRL